MEAATPQPVPHVAEARLRVRYAETDQMHVVYHSNYVIWFEVGRVELMRSLGYTYRELEQDGYHLPVAEVRCRFKKPALYDDLIIVRARMTQLRSTLIRFGYEVLRESDGELLAEGETVHLVAGPEFKLAPLPPKYLVPFRKAAGL